MELLDVPRPDVGVDLDVERGGAEADEPHPQRVLDHLRVGRERLADPPDEPADLVRARLVAHADGREEPEAVAVGEVLDLDRRQLPVRHAHHRPLEGADAGGAQPDVLHGSHPGAVPAEVADADRLVQAERHPAEEVLHGLLRRERQRDAAEAEAGHDPRDVEPEVLEQAEEAERDDEHLGDAAAEVEHRDRGAALLAHHPLPGRAGQDVHEPQADPGDEQDGEAAGDADEEAPGRARRGGASRSRRGRGRASP